MAGQADALLDAYRSKRDFAKTQEPDGSGKTPSKDESEGLAFVVQKHDATRLHFDFRIELDGVLKSWAVTKGPSNSPGDKRLAVRVEDHPLEYGGFEGTIPKGEYGGGTVMLWDRGTWEPIGDPHEGLAKGDLKMRIHGERMTGEYVLVHMKGRDQGGRENWLLIKHRDDQAREKDTLQSRYTRSVATGRNFEEIAKGAAPKKKTRVPAKAEWSSARGEEVSAPTPRKAGKTGQAAAMPRYRGLQLATLSADVPAGPDWLFELKYDGYRCLAAVKGEQVKLYTRNGKDWTEKFSALVSPLAALTEGTALIDGEICAFDKHGKTDFSSLQAALSDGGPLVMFAFDLLELDGEDLTGKPLTERKAKLKDLLGDIDRHSPIQFSDHVTGHGQKVLDTVCGQGHEGVIAKRAGSRYRSERTKDWLKIKCIRRQEFVIAGWSPSTKRNTFASLLLGTYDGDTLVYRGRVGTGFSEDVAAELQSKLDSLSRKTSPFADLPKDVARDAHFVTPKLVAEVAYAELTANGHLRHPSFQGLRTDKPADEIVLETPQVDPKAESGGAGSGGGKGRRTMDEKSTGDELTTAAGEAAAEAAGVRLTSPERVAFPQQGVTKGELVAYYAAVAERMLAYAGDRPLSLVRCPQGRSKHCFFQKHDTGGFPKQLKSMTITEATGETEDYFYVDDVAGLLAGTQMNVLEWHIWGSRRADIEKPDRLIFDIDPDEGLGFEEVKRAALDIRDVLKSQWKLKSFPMVTGGKGVHVIVPLTPKAEWPEVKAFCKKVATDLAGAEPDRFTANMSKAKRKGRLFIDYLRNDRGSTAIAPFSTRSREGAPVAVPVSWTELASLEAANQFSLADGAVRAKKADPWKGYSKISQTLPSID